MTNLTDNTNEVILAELDNLHERIDTLEASLALLTAISTRTETRLVKLIIHLGAEHLINAQPRNV